MLEKFIHYLKVKKGGVAELGPSDCKTLLHENKTVVLLDVRESDEWNAGHIPGAKHLPLSELELRAKSFVDDQNSIVICQCAAGKRSIVAGQILQKHGYKNVAAMSGGIWEWEKNGYPVEH